jgi:hypothetical protein
MSNQYLKSSVRKMQTTNISSMIDSLAARFPVCMASDEFHFFPQARAKAFDWSIWDDFSPNALAETTAQLKDWEQQLDSHSKHSLSFDQEIDSSMMGRILRTLREQFELVRVQETQPTFYLTIIAIGLAEAIEAGLQAIEKRSYNLSRFVDQAIQNLISVPHLLREIGMEMLTEANISSMLKEPMSSGRAWISMNGSRSNIWDAG